MVTGTKQFTFDGHDAPVYSICPHAKEDIHVRNTLAAVTDCGSI